MPLKGKLEAIIYAAEEPVTVDQMAVLLRRDVLAELAKEAANASAEASTGEAPEPALESSELASEPTADAMIEAAVDDSPEGASSPSPFRRRRSKIQNYQRSRRSSV